METCPKCGAGSVIVNAPVSDMQGRNLYVQVYARPSAKLFKKAKSSKLSARVCVNCGFTELYAEKPDQLRQAHQTAQKTDRSSIGRTGFDR